MGHPIVYPLIEVLAWATRLLSEMQSSKIGFRPPGKADHAPQRADREGVRLAPIRDGNHPSIPVRVNVMASCGAVEDESVRFKSTSKVAGGDPARDAQTVTTTAEDSSSRAVGILRPSSIRIWTSACSNSLMRWSASSGVSPHVTASSISGQYAW